MRDNEVDRHGERKRRFDRRRFLQTASVAGTAAVGSLSIGSAAAAQATNAADNGGDDADLEGTYRIEAVHSGKVLDVEGVNDGGDGANVQQWPFVDAADQYWELHEVDDGIYVVQNAATGKVLELADESTKNRVNVQQGTFTEAEHQYWAIESDGDAYVFINALSGKLLDVQGVSTRDGTNVHQWEDTGRDNQRWLLEPR